MTDTHPTFASTFTPSSHPPPSTQRPHTKLTKKQKKALAFRDKSSKSKTKHTPTLDQNEQQVEMEDPHVPNMEKSPRAHRASSSLQMGYVEDRSAEGASRGSKTTHESTARTSVNTSSSSLQEAGCQKQQNAQQARKRVNEVGDQQHDGERQGKPSKKRKRGQLDGVDDELDWVGTEGGVAKEKAGHKKRKGEKTEFGLDGVEEEGEGEEMSEEGEEGGAKRGKGKQRFILFVGNLKYTTSLDTIQSHFSACDPPPEVRLLTPKASATGKTTTKSKGCAFLEFPSKASLQQALRQHHSMLEGRMINVELTAGGGGKSEKRMEKLRERNKELLGQRKKKADKKAKKEALPSRPDKPQRYSATSGMEQSTPDHKRTWTVAGVAEDEVHRGGQKHKKTRGARKSKARDWGTGVNAIPVG